MNYRTFVLFSTLHLAQLYIATPVSALSKAANGSTVAETLNEVVYQAGTDSININDLIVHDPCILADTGRKLYYIYEKFSPERFAGLVEGAPEGKAGVFFQASKDLITWSRPKAAFIIPDDFWADDDAGPWAPEVHMHNGKYHMFTSCNAWNKKWHENSQRPPITMRASQILIADSPEGPFRPFANKPATLDGEMTLDATFWYEDEQPWMVYCHEWVQTTDGKIVAIRLAPDLSSTIGEPIELLDAGKVEWTKKEINYRGTIYPGVVTDGPFLYRTKNGRLLMIWSSWSKDRAYALAVAYSESGKVTGPWKYNSEPILWDDRGHGMIFTDFEGNLLLCVHRYFHYPQTRVQLFKLEDTGNDIRVQGQFLGHE